jgi:flagellar hook protein FlgE
MMRSLFAGVSGLRNHQVEMDVIGNNIANVNTVGFKSSRVTFEEAFAQLVSGARPPGSDSNETGLNPYQVGLGMNIGSIDLLFTQGNLEATGVKTDLAIQGDSFFVVSDGLQNFYTRAGNFVLDADGNLVTATNGLVVQGRTAVDGVLSDTVGNITLPFGQKSAARATENALITGNLNAEAAVGETRDTSITVYDAMGVGHEMTITFEKATPTTWTYTVAATDGTVGSGGAGTLTFDTEGRLAAPVPTDPVVFTPDGGAADVSVTLNFGAEGDLGGISQFAAPSTATLREQDGNTMGSMESFAIDQSGNIRGAFSNGSSLVLGQIALADFNNPSGLFRTGNNMYQISANSGAPVIGFAGEGSQSAITAGALEMSNVDLAQEFTNMITAQRGFQSNARVISTSDEMLQELVNLRR